MRYEHEMHCENGRQHVREKHYGHGWQRRYGHGKLHGHGAWCGP
jgi:hypothetical protein